MTALSRYAEVLRPEGARTALLGGMLGRVSMGMNGLALLLLMKQATGSYGDAGLVCACYAIALAGASPIRARSADRRGPARVLRITALLHPLAFALVIALAQMRAPVPADVLAAVALGVSVPPLGGVMRALWAHLLEPRVVPVAFAMEAVVVELCFITGPLLVALVTSLASASFAVAASGVLATGGTLVLVAVPVVRETTPHPDRPTHYAGPLVSSAVRACLLCVLFVGAGFGAIEVGVLVFVEQHGHARPVAGLVLAIWSAGSALGGLTYGALHPRADVSRQLPVLVTLVGLAAWLPLLAPSVVLLAVLLALGGCTIAPYIAANSVLLSRVAPVGTVTEAFAWSSSMIFAGVSAGTALAGSLADAHGAHGPFAVAAGAGVCVALASVLAVPVLRGVDRPAVL